MDNKDIKMEIMNLVMNVNKQAADILKLKRKIRRNTLEQVQTNLVIIEELRIVHERIDEHHPEKVVFNNCNRNN